MEFHSLERTFVHLIDKKRSITLRIWFPLFPYIFVSFLRTLSLTLYLSNNRSAWILRSIQCTNEYTLLVFELHLFGILREWKASQTEQRNNGSQQQSWTQRVNEREKKNCIQHFMTTNVHTQLENTHWRWANELVMLHNRVNNAYWNHEECCLRTVARL